MADSIRKKALEEKIRIKTEAYKNMEQVRKYSTEDLQAKIKETSMVTFLNSICSARMSQLAACPRQQISVHPKNRPRVKTALRPGGKIIFCPLSRKRVDNYFLPRFRAFSGKRGGKIDFPLAYYLDPPSNLEFLVLA